MRIFSSSYLPKLTLLGSLAAALVSCEEPELPEAKPVSTSTVGQARVLVINAAPGSTGTAVTLDNAAFGSALPYLGASATTPISAGQRLFIYNEPTNIPSNAPAGSATRPVVSRTAFLGGTNYTVFLTDPTNRAIPNPPTTDQGGLRTLVLTDIITAPAVATNARVRFVNLSPSGTYGIYNTLGGAPLFSAAPTRAFRAVSSTTNNVTTTYSNFTEVAAGTYALDVRSSATAVIAGSQQSVAFAAGKSYTLYVRGVAGTVTAPSATPIGISVVQHN
jgi:hypothetical protein